MIPAPTTNQVEVAVRSRPTRLAGVSRTGVVTPCDGLGQGLVGAETPDTLLKNTNTDRVSLKDMAVGSIFKVSGQTKICFLIYMH